MKINNNKIKSLFLLSLVGSGLGKEEKTKNQTEILNNNQLPEVAVNFTERQNNPDPILIFAGYPIVIEGEKNAGNCTVGFAIIVNDNSNEDCFLTAGSGFITSARCCKEADNCVNFDVFSSDEKKVNVGRVDDSVYFESYSSAPDFLFLFSPYLNEEKEVKPVPYVAGEKVLYPVIGLGTVAPGGEVCAYGTFSGYLCGNLVETGLSIGSGRDMTFAGVNKVDLGEGHGFENEEDLGGPVYVTNNIGERTVAQALGYISDIDNSDLNHKIFYYTPLSVFFDYSKSKSLGGCEVELMTYNETNAQEYQELLAQIEIPPKK